MRPFRHKRRCGGTNGGKAPFDIRDCAGLGTISLFVTRRNSSTAVLSSATFISQEAAFMAARKRRRRQAYDDMKSERASGDLNRSEASRRSMTHAESLNFFQCIDTKQSSRFGLSKLRQLRLNESIDASWLPNGGKRLTLLEYAARRNREKIVSSLLRGGADPRVRGEHYHQLTRTTATATTTKKTTTTTMTDRTPPTTPQQHLATFPLQYGTHVTIRLERARELGRSVPMLTTTMSSCALCLVSPPVEPLACGCAVKHSDVNQLACEDCCWNRAMMIDRRSNEEGFHFCDVCMEETKSTTNMTLTTNLNSSSSALESKQRYMLLPIDIDSATSSSTSSSSAGGGGGGRSQQRPPRPGKIKTRGMSKCEIRRAFVGGTRKKRDEQLWRAAGEKKLLFFFFFSSFI